MRKIKIISLLLIIIMAFTLMAGCDVITKNKERDLNQVVTEVSYKGLKDTVNKAEVFEAYNSYGFYYTQYYGYTLEEAFDMIIDSLANRKLLLLHARYELAKEKGQPFNVEMSRLLTDAEIDAAIKATNTTMQGWYEGIVKELEKEAEVAKDKDKENDKDNDKDKDEEEEEEALKPRPVRPADDAEPEFDPNATIEEIEKKFFEKEHTDSEFSEKAIKQLKKELSDNFRTYEYYLEKQYETQILQSYQRMLTAGYTPSEKEILEKYQSYEYKNKESYANDINSYKTDIADNLKTTVYHPVSGYGYVYNILLKFSDEQLAMLETMKDSGTVAEEYIKQYRNELSKEIKVNVSNPDYDPEYKCEDCEKKECENENCPAKAYSELDVDVNIILQRIFNSFNEIENNSELNNYEKFMAKREEATKWVYLVNDDAGMYDKDANNIILNNENGYLVTPEGEESSYVAEFTDLGRDMIKKGLGTFTKDGTVEGMYCITDFGIHIMFVSYIPFDKNAVGFDGGKVFLDDSADNGLLPLDYIVSYGRYGSEVLVSKTIKDIISDNLVSANKNDKYTIASQALIAENKDNISKKTKVINKMIKEIKGK